MNKKNILAIAFGFVAMTAVTSQAANAGPYNSGWGNSYNNGFAVNNSSCSAPYGGQVYNNTSSFRRPLGNGIDARQGNLAAAIQRGIASGRLSQGEANSLLNRQARINEMEARFRASNGLSFGERARLEQQLNRLNGQLRSDLNNRRISW